MKQYDQSPRLTALLDNMRQYLTVPVDDFYDIVWNIDTAQGFGLDIWGRIVGVERYISVPGDDYFGFQTGANDWEPFNQAPFYSGSPASNTYRLSDDAFRLLILTKAFANITETTAPKFNALLQILFAGRGRCYVNDLGDMQMRYTFEFALEPWEFVVITNGAVMPRPAGVKCQLLAVAKPVFGFAEMGEDASPFNVGTMLSINGVANVA